LRSRAEAQLAVAGQLDYQAPAAPVRIAALNKAADLFRDACVTESDVGACAWAASLSVSTPVREEESYRRTRVVTDVLIPLCLANNADACRLFDSDLARIPSSYSDVDAACGRGLASACYAASFVNTRNGVVAPLSPAEMLRLEKQACDLGEPRSCKGAQDDLVEAKAPAAEIEQLATKRLAAAEQRCARGYATSCWAIPHNDKRTQAAATDGCMRGFLDECEAPVEDDAASDKLWARVCSMTGRACSPLANGRADALAKRDALEHGCQFADVEQCVKLVLGYRSKAYPEPVPGRGAALATYLCTPGPNLPGDVCDQVKQ